MKTEINFRGSCAYKLIRFCFNLPLARHSSRPLIHDNEKQLPNDHASQVTASPLVTCHSARTAPRHLSLLLALLGLTLLASAGFAQVTVSGSAGGTVDGSYTSLTQAGGAFAAINGAGSQAGQNILITITADVATEDGTNSLNNGGWTSLTVNPVGARIVSGSVATPLINLNAASNVTIDGLNASGNSLTISNASSVTTAGTSTIRFINDATSNTIQNATINGAATGASTGTIIFSTTTGATGNDNNTVTACNIGPVGATFPSNAIFSSGTTTSQATRNSGIQITNNNIFDFFTNTAVIANGVLASAGTTDMTITGNSFYQTATRTMTVAASGFIGISIADTSSINNTISNNFIGGSTASAGGTAWTQTGAVTHTFIGIRMSVGSSTPSSLQNNRIRNLNISTSTTSTINAGISAVTGAMNIGTTTGNTIGATTGTGSITWTGAGAGASFAGILAGTGTPNGINISNNNIGSITVAGAGTTVLYGIRMEGAATAAYTVNLNTIGSTTTANSISSNSNTTFVGISSSNTGFPASITNNTIQNWQHTSAGTSASFRGIETLGSVNGHVIDSNIIRDVTTASPGTWFDRRHRCGARHLCQWHGKRTIDFKKQYLQYFEHSRDRGGECNRHQHRLRWERWNDECEPDVQPFRRID